MITISTYRVSKYLQEVKRSDGYGLFHSLFGGLVIVDQTTKKILDEFYIHSSIENILSKYEDHHQVHKIIQFFLKRFFIVEDHVDEYNLVVQEKERRLTVIDHGEFLDSIQLVVTNKCNFNCEYCFLKTMYSSNERYELQRSPENQMMSFDVAKQGIDTLIALAHKNHIPYITVEFFGGEPLCNYPLIKKILETYENGCHDEIGILYSMVTNGSLLNEEMSELLSKYEVHVALSYDSPSVDYRLQAEDNKLTDMIQEKIDLLNRHDVTIVINSALTKQNMGSFDAQKLIKFLDLNRIDKLILTQELDITFYEEQKNIDNMIDKTLEIVRYAKQCNIEVSGTWAEIFNQINRNTPINMIRGCKSCAGCSSKLSLEPCGDIFACKSTSSHFGHISDMKNLFLSNHYKRFVIRGYENNPACRNCVIEGMCSGLCVGSIEKKYHDIFNIEKKACKIFKDISLELIRTVDHQLTDSLYWNNKK